MKRAGPIERKNPLRVGLPLKRSALPRSKSQLARKAVRRVSAMKTARPRLAVPAGAKRTLTARSGALCELQASDVCSYWATDPCHRNGRKAGGRHGPAAIRSARLSNVMHGCRPCHNWCHRHPERAEACGWIVREGFDPSCIPVYRMGVLVLLDDEGGWVEAPESEER